VQIYTWMDASLKEISELLKDAIPSANNADVTVTFCLVCIDLRGSLMMKQVSTAPVLLCSCALLLCCFVALLLYCPIAPLPHCPIAPLPHCPIAPLLCRISLPHRAPHCTSNSPFITTLTPVPPDPVFLRLGACLQLGLGRTTPRLWAAARSA
jgi:hypothetical protein